MNRHRLHRALVALALVCAALWGAACASQGGLQALLVDSLRIQIHERGLNPDDIDLPFELTPEMRDWLRHTAELGGDPDNRLDQLLRSLLHRGESPLVYESGHTGSAREVWETGKANCLAFTHLFVGMAREVDLPVYYLRVSDLQSFEKDGDLVIASEHITAAYGPANQRRVLDFSDRPVTPYHFVEPISDLTAVALYYSNRGAERIREGRNGEALVALDTAVRLAPELSDAWVNYGVALRRSGRSREAESAYRRALELDPAQLSAYQNLAALLDLQGRRDEARDLLAITDRGANRNPYSYLVLGDLSLRRGRLDEAERFYRRALRLDPEQAESNAALGQWALSAGKPREARSWLKRAEKLDPANPRVGELSRQIKATSRES
jgi:tetratricopeptide (TPR) repeat protein